MGDIPVIFGLGNPGAQYAWNRHNAGFMVLDHLATMDRHSVKYETHPLFWSRKIQYPFPAILIKPRTFMNLSGDALLAYSRKDFVSRTKLLIIYDDLDLKLGQMRWKPSGSAGGQKGMKDILRVCGTQDIQRLRIGIGPRPEQISVVDFVLGDFSSKELRIFEKLKCSAVESLVCWVQNGISVAMSQFNGLKCMNPEIEEKQEE
jgi:PTH1 family peptidyl-tRNA hydrolase